MEGRVGEDAAGYDDPRSRARRRDRSKSDEWVGRFLAEAGFGFLAMVSEGGGPHLNSNIFVYDPDRHCIYVHTHRTGRTRESMEDDQAVVFSVGAMGRLLPAPEALEFSVEYSSVTAFGRGRVVEDRDEAKEALQKLLDKYAPHLRPGRDYRATTDKELDRTSVYRIDIETWSGKQKEVAPHFPGAFLFPSVPVPFPDAPSGEP